MATVAGRLSRRWPPLPAGIPRGGAALSLDADQVTLLAALAIGGAIVAGMAMGVGPLVTAAAYAAILVAVISPQIGLATLAFMATLRSPMVVPAPGFNTALVGAIILGCIYRLPIERPKLRMSVPFLLLLAFVFYVAVQQVPEMLGGYSGEVGHLVGYQFFQLATGFGAVIAAALVLRGRSPYPYLVTGLAAALLAAFLAVATFNNPSVGPPLAGLLAKADTGTRAVGPFGNPNYFGMLEAVAICVAAGWMIHVRGWVRMLLIGTAAALVVGLLFSLSRGAALAMFAGIACLAFVRNPRLGVAVTMVGLAVAAVVYPVFVETRLSYTNGEVSSEALSIMASSDQGRLSAVLAGPLIFLTSPLFGVGWGHYSFMSAQVSGTGVPIAAHNWYMNTLAEQGLVGITLWMLLLVALVAGLRIRPSPAREIGLAVLAVYAVGSLFLEPPGSFQTTLLPIVVLVATLVSDWSANARRASPRTSARGAG